MARQSADGKTVASRREIVEANSANPELVHEGWPPARRATVQAPLLVQRQQDKRRFEFCNLKQQRPFVLIIAASLAV